jgi:hypothetical protein
LNGKLIFACWIEIDKRTTNALDIPSIKPVASCLYPGSTGQVLHAVEEEPF